MTIATRILVVAGSLLAAACGEDSPGGAEADAGIDAPGNTGEYCHVSYEELSCRDGIARSTVYWRGGSTSMTLCQRPPDTTEAVCATGCAIVATVRLPSKSVFERPTVGRQARALCAEAPERAAGDSCVFTDGEQCLPTRSHLAADGTVSDHTYLKCTSGNLCEPIDAPVVADYLLPCDAALVTQHGGSGVNGVVAGTLDNPKACLLAWDEATQTTRSGVTTACIADWMCPRGSLCDDRIAPLGSTAQTPICKPGPRGTLTPAMLAAPAP